VVRRQSQQARHLHAPTSDVPFYWLLPMRVKRLSQNKEKNLPQTKLGPARAAHIVTLFAYLINRISSIAYLATRIWLYQRRAPSQ